MIDLIATPNFLKRKYVERGLYECVKNGLVSVQTNDPLYLQVYEDLRSEGKLPIRVFLTPFFSEVF